jgi:cell pole-organizing protein PopZ
MNKPAPKEPSMDEILSSIRQIIADDDAAVAPRKPPAPPAASVSPAPAPRPLSSVPPAVPPPNAREPAPLALTAEQMLTDDDHDGGNSPAQAISFNDILGGGDADAEAAMPADAPPLVDPEDIAFDPDDEASMPSFSVEVEEPEPAPAPPQAPVARAAPPPRPAPSVARAAPMPDPKLSSDMAEELLAPTTTAAAKHAFTKLNGLNMAGSGQTLDALMREMLRPMLKEWLDENLPAVVERMVEKEIARISRGGE